MSPQGSTKTNVRDCEQTSLVFATGWVDLSSHNRPLARLEPLLYQGVGGGVDFGNDLMAQRWLCHPHGHDRELRTLQFACQGWCFAFLLAGLRRYPIEHTRLSLPPPGDTWWHHPKANLWAQPSLVVASAIREGAIGEWREGERTVPPGQGSRQSQENTKPPPWKAFLRRPSSEGLLRRSS
jgi:hypothetical protein